MKPIDAGKTQTMWVKQHETEKCLLKKRSSAFQTFPSEHQNHDLCANEHEAASSWSHSPFTVTKLLDFYSLSWIMSFFCLSFEPVLGQQAAFWEALALNGVIIVGKRWSCRGRPRADSWSLSADTKLLLMRTTAGDLFSPVLQRTHIQINRYTHTFTHTHTGEENISEHKGQSRAEISGGRQEVDIKQWNISPSSTRRTRSSEKLDLHKSRK